MGNSERINPDDLLKLAYEKYYSYVYKFCLSRMPKDRASAEDCTQEAFLVLYKKYKAGEEVEYVSAFLLQTARNFVLKQLREIEKRQNEMDIDDVVNIPSQSEDMDEHLSFEQYSKEISAALSDKEAELFKLRYIEELEIEAIASIVDKPIANIYVELSRIRKKLRKIFPKDYFSS